MVWTPGDIPDLKGRVAIVTGGNAGLGFETAKYLASHGAHVFIASRSIVKGERAVSMTKSIHVNAQVDCLPLDLSSFRSIRSFVETFKSRKLALHILVNNAGTFMPPFSKTKEGFEITVGSAYVGHALLTDLLLDVLKSSAPSRIVVVTGSAESVGVVDWDDLGGERATTSGMDMVARCCLLKLMWAFELNKRLDSSGVSVLSCHPGVAATELLTKMRKGLLRSALSVLSNLFTQSAAKGAYSTLYAATHPNLPGGTYYGPNCLNMGNTVCRAPVNSLFRDPESWKRAYDLTHEIIALKS